MERRRWLSRTKIASVVAVVLGATVVLPAAAFGQQNPVDDLLKGVNGILGGGAGGGGGGQVTPQAGSPPTYTPPLHGSNPHGQGTVGTVDITPNNDLPQPSDPPPEDISIGDARGEENNGTYRGRVYLVHANILGIINTDGILPPVVTNEGETNAPPLAPLQTIIDNSVCPPLTSPAGCVTLLPINSSTTSTGSQNSFGVASTNLTPAQIVSVQTDTASSSGNISETSTCQTATGTSNVEDADVGLTAVPGAPVISADALQGSSTSTACNDGSQSQSNSSTVVALQGGGLPLPAAGCANGTPNTNFTALVPLIGLVCNADDSNNGQTSNPYGVREALTVFALSVLPGGDPLLKVTTAGPESHAVAPAAATPPTTTPPTTPGAGNPGGGPGDGGPGNPGGPGGPPGGPTTTVAQAGGGELAFTGANLVWLGLIGGMLIVGGVGLARATTRRHSRAAA